MACIIQYLQNKDKKVSSPLTSVVRGSLFRSPIVSKVHFTPQMHILVPSLKIAKDTERMFCSLYRFGKCLTPVSCYILVKKSQTRLRTEYYRNIWAGAALPSLFSLNDYLWVINYSATCIPYSAVSLCSLAITIADVQTRYVL